MCVCVCQCVAGLSRKSITGLRLLSAANETNKEANRRNTPITNKTLKQTKQGKTAVVVVVLLVGHEKKKEERKHRYKWRRWRWGGATNAPLAVS